jgi:hypothetical protein
MLNKKDVKRKLHKIDGEKNRNLFSLFGYQKVLARFKAQMGLIKALLIFIGVAVGIS